MGDTVNASGSPPEDIVLVGPLPPPHGGVSTFLERLALTVPPVIRMILDTGAGAATSRQWRHELRVDVRPLPSGTVRLWRALRNELATLTQGTTVVMNVSHPQGVLRYLPAFVSDLPTVVVLHHGTPFRRPGPVGRIVELLTGYLLRSCIDTVVCLNQAQAQFIRDAYRVPNTSIRFASSYVPVDLVLDQADEVPPAPERTRVVASGEARAYHHFDQLIELWNSPEFSREAELVICLYGPENNALESVLRKAASEAEGVNLRRGLDSWAFLELLRASDVYVRASSVDAFGIAAADAIRLGLEVVATDVCERYPGCRLIPPEDPEALHDALRDAIRAGRLSGRRKAKTPWASSNRAEISFLDVLGIEYRHLLRCSKDSAP